MISNSEDAGIRPAEDANTMQPLRDGDTSIEPDPADPAQADWDRTANLDADESSDDDSATGADPAELPSEEDDIPVFDLPGAASQPETRGAEPLGAELGDQGQGDLAPEDI